MKERGILMSAPMVRALLEGRKTQTRRVVKPQPVFSTAGGDSWEWHGGPALVRASYGAPYVHTNRSHVERAMLKVCPYGARGDRLWVRETWQHANYPLGPYQPGATVFYAADYDDRHRDRELGRKWVPAIHMPRSASRITLELTEVRVERLQEISEADAIAEGAQVCDFNDGVLLDQSSPQGCYRWGYRALWESINGAGSWDVNPWVWALTFRGLNTPG